MKASKRQQPLASRLFRLGPALAVLLAIGIPAAARPEPATETFIVQASSAAVARTAVEKVGGRVTHELGIINAVGAELTAEQREVLEETAGIRIHRNRKTRTDGSICTVTGGYRLLESKKLVWEIANQGPRGVTVAGVFLEWPSQQRGPGEDPAGRATRSTRES